ncbi:hypothetical protein COCMIDRAFT_103980 [Bipolaris oryzae ATCC 44560]|uniref:Uncharacterized protein n=1 Tax=Bipolaris oryzae ATCC 44560 TaxID=930090 RepID=W6YXI6_COCMI|nr:uncharacterized protein COCMIDRAFT_103980 [Bipolaris oryzae ATCC 44560]EUC42255.1 hypothetical protein COCMIDRAFT_103980 [Bipolaris oryzae ATCC 44560]
MTTYHVSDVEFNSLQGKNIVVIGGVQGIGKATVELAHKNGATVLLADINDTLAQELVSQLKERVIFRHCDMSDWNSVLDLFEFAQRTLNVIHAVVCNAGVVGCSRLFGDERDSQTGRLLPPNLDAIHVNLIGAIHVVKAAAHYLGADDDDFKRAITITGSTAGLVDAPGVDPLYVASKTGLVGLLRSMKMQLASRNINVNLLAPWATGDTPMFTDELLKIWKGLPINKPIDLAKALLMPTTRPEIHGKVFWVGGGKIVEIEDKLRETRPQWLGQELSDGVEEGRQRLSGL